MQRLEVSGAVRPIYGSLGVKRLMKILPVGTELFLGDGPIDRQTDMTKLKVAFREKANKKPIVDTSPNHTCHECLALQQKIAHRCFSKQSTDEDWRLLSYGSVLE